jgi:hypothetical protein
MQIGSPKRHSGILRDVRRTEEWVITFPVPMMYMSVVYGRYMRRPVPYAVGLIVPLSNLGDVVKQWTSAERVCRLCGGQKPAEAIDCHRIFGRHRIGDDRTEACGSGK